MTFSKPQVSENNTFVGMAGAAGAEFGRDGQSQIVPAAAPERQQAPASTRAIPVRQTQFQLEDPLAYLPCSTIAEFAQGQPIYGRTRPSGNIYLVIDGKVKVYRNTSGGRHVVVDIYLPDEFFGESGFIGHQEHEEDAVALDSSTKVMMWSMNQIEEEMTRQPRLSIAMIQFMAARSKDFANRIESFSSDNVCRRLVRSLIRFSERLGHESNNGFAAMMPFTHELLSQYVGTSREIVTFYMNQLRRDGYLRYSRKGISLNRELLREWLKSDAKVPASHAA